MPMRTEGSWPAALIDGTVVVGGTAVQLIATATPARSVVIQARSNNSGTVTIGADNGITSQGAGHTLVAGASLPMSVDDLSLIWLIGSAAGQNVDFLAVR